MFILFWIMFSILIAHYNNYHYFVDCYESIISQTYQDFEVIIVDDCSTDGSLEKIKDLVKEDARFKIFKNQENRGVGFTKKRCVELASGEFCGFVDPDDALIINALEESVAAFQKHKEVVAVHSKYYECDDELNIQNVCRTSQSVPKRNPLFFNIFYEITHFFSFKRSVYEQIGGLNDTLTSAIDQDLYLKLYDKGDFCFIKMPLYLYRIHSKGVSQEASKKEKLRNNWNKVLESTFKRRGMKLLYSQPLDEIDDYAKFIFEKQNTFWKRLLRKLK